MDSPILAALLRGRRTTLTIALAAVLLAIFASVAYAEVFEGGPGPDDFDGTPQSDRAVMKGGNDTANGLDRSDDLFGNGGNDELRGDDGTDFANGGKNRDLIVGGRGEDELVGSFGNDTIFTGTEEDGDKVPDEVQCGEGFDVVTLSGNDHASHNLQAGKCEVINHY